MINLLPLAEGETISTVLPLPEDEAEWGELHVMFATAKGTVRRNSMDAFTNVPSNGKIAMRFEDDSDDRLIGVALLTEDDDVLLATRQGKAIRFAGDRRARVPEPHFDRRARHDAARGRRGHLALDPPRRSAPRRGARGLSARPRRGRKASAKSTLSAERMARVRGGARSSSSPSAPTAMASAPRPMNIAAPIAAARASPTSTISTATARSSPASRRTRAIS